jgi:hypothetical protein
LGPTLEKSNQTAEGQPAHILMLIKALIDKTFATMLGKRQGFYNQLTSNV